MRVSRAVTFFIFTIVLTGLAAGGELRVCSDSVAPFLGFKDEQPYGIEYDLLTGFAKAQGLVFTLTDYKDLTKIWENLDSGGCDVVAALITRTAERQKRYDFSEPYFPVRTLLMVPTGKQLASVSELKGKRILATAGSNHEAFLRTLPGVEVVGQHGQRSMAEAVLAGKADGLTTDTAMAVGLMAELPGLQVGLLLSEREVCAFPMRKGSPLKAPLDAYLKAIKQDGTYEAILKRYMDAETVKLVLDE
jgi:ABC-type amino acid transport substrate-binding protein